MSYNNNDQQQRLPAKTFNAGDVSLSAWEQTGNYGTYYSYSINKTYTDRSGTKKYTTYFTLKDLGCILGVIWQAIMWETMRKAQGASAGNIIGSQNYHSQQQQQSIGDQGLGFDDDDGLPF